MGTFDRFGIGGYYGGQIGNSTIGGGGAGNVQGSGIGAGGGKATTKNKHVPVPPKPHLFTYSQPVFSFNSASFYGLTIPVSLGTRAIVGVPVFASPIKTVTGPPATSTGKKRKTTINNRPQNQYIDFAVSLGYQGSQFADLVATNVRRIWADETLIYDASATTGWNTAAGINFKLYKGTEDQLPDPILVSWLGTDEGIAFRGEIILMFYDFPLTKYNMNHVPVIRAEIKDTFTQQTNVYDMARIGGATAVRAATLYYGVDWYRRRVYQFDAVAKVMHVFDMLNMIELFQFSTIGIGTAGGITPFAGGLYAEPRFGYLITSEGLSNSDPFYVIDPTSGNILSTWGVAGAFISNTDTHFVCPTDFCEMTQADPTGPALILTLAVFFGNLGVLQLTSAGVLTYAWTPGDVNTIFDVFTIIGEGQINGVYRWSCPGDLIEGSTPATSNAGTAVMASYFELSRVVVSPDPGGAVTGGSFGASATGSSGWQGRHDLLWRPPLGHNVNWLFRDVDINGEFVVMHRNATNNEMFMSRIRINDHLLGKLQPDPGFSGSTIGYADTLWQVGPIPTWPAISLVSTSAGASANTAGADGINTGWQLSNPGSSHTLAYADTLANPLDRHITVVNTQDGTWAQYSLNNEFLLDGTSISTTAGIQIESSQFWDGDSEQLWAWSFLGSSGLGYTFGPARMSPFIAASGGGIPLYTILDWLMQYAGFTEDELSISNDLSDTFSGSLMQELGVSVWDMLSDMSKALQFEVFESEGKVKFTKVGRGSALSITYALDPDDDLMSLGGDQEGKGNNDTTPGGSSAYAGFTTERDWHSDAPQTIELHYLDETNEYTVNLARANKTTFPVSTTENDKVERLDVPLIMTPEKAFVYAARALYEAYAGSTIHEMRLGSKYLRMEPGDVVSLTINDMDYVLKITEGTINADYSMQVLASSFCNLEAIATTGEGPINNGGQVVAGPSLTQGFIIDTPPLDPADIVNDTNLRLYSEITSYGQAGWQGGSLFTSPDTNAGPFTEVLRDTVTGGSYVGIAASGISGHAAYATDLDTTLEVNFTVLPTAITGSTGYLLVGRPNRWEFMSYGTVVAGSGSRQYFFSNLVRGLRGTEWHTGDHIGGDYVLLYPNLAHITILDFDSSLISGTIYTKVCGVNEDPEVAVPYSFVESQNFEKPWAPTSLKAVTISGGSSGITLSWMRRSRMETPIWGSGATPPLEPGWTEQYEIDILNGPGGTVLRTVTGVTGSSYTYASGNVTTDFGAVPASISFNVYQISPVVGRGFPGGITTDVLSVT